MNDKPRIASGYVPAQTERAEQLLLEIWSHLGDYHDYLVLVGGLAPRYLVPQDHAPGAPIPLHCGTMDVDFGVSLAVADAEAYNGIRETLERIGLRPDVNERGNPRRHSFVMDHPSGPVNVDFLTTRYDGPDNLPRTVQGALVAIQAEGLRLALKNPLERPLEGKTLTGGIVNATLRVCRPVPFVVLKALAFANRREAKDANDLVYVLRYACGEPNRLAQQATPEEREADSFKKALRLMAEDFASPDHDGPVRYANFCEQGDKTESRNQAFAAVQEFLQTLQNTRKRD